MSGARGLVFRALGSAVPGLAALIAVSVMITRADVAWLDLFGYLAYVVCFLTVPGVLVWRLLWTGGRGSLLEHAIFGTLLGIVLELPVYLVGVAIGFPRLTVLLPVAAVTFCLVRKDRRELFLPRTEPVGALVSWALAAALTYAALWETRIGWTAAAPAWGAPANPNGDQAFHLALLTELRHHAMPTMPFVDGEPLRYHWFVNAHLAAASWWTHAPNWVLLDRLLLPTCLVLVLGAVAVIGRRVSGRAAGGALAVVILAFVGDLSPFRWSQLRSNFDERFLAYFDPVSPSLQFSIAMLLLFSLVVVHVLRVPRIGVRDVVLVGLASVLLPLAKGSALPLALGGLGAVLVIRLLARERPRRREFGLFAWACVVFEVAQLTIFSGASEMQFSPFDIRGYVAWNLGLSSPGGGPPIPATTAVSVFAITGLVISWLCSGLGAFGFARGGVWRDPRAVFLVGSGVAGCLAPLAFGNPHLAQDYFARSSPALLAIGSAWGLLTLVQERPPVQIARVLVGGLGGGFAIAWLASRTVPAIRPTLTEHNQHHLIAVMLRPHVVIALLLLVAGLLLSAAARRGRIGRAAGLAVLLAMAVGLGLLRVPGTFRVVADIRPPPAVSPAQASIGRGGIAATTWLRDHSAVDDLLATNAHYLRPGGNDNRHFWLAALAERRVLVEGWGYTPQTGSRTAADSTSFYVPFWDQALLRGNDLAFTDPSAATLAYLSERKVSWLFVDDRFPVDLTGLRTVADLRFHSGRYWVFRVR